MLSVYDANVWRTASGQAMTISRPLAPHEIKEIEADALNNLARHPRDVDASDKLRLIATIRAAEDAGERLAAGRGEYLSAEMVDALLLDGENPVRAWRMHRGLTLDALAQQAGVGKSFLSRVENGGRRFSIRTLKALAGALDYEMDDVA